MDLSKNLPTRFSSSFGAGRIGNQEPGFGSQSREGSRALLDV